MKTVCILFAIYTGWFGQRDGMWEQVRFDTKDACEAARVELQKKLDGRDLVCIDKVVLRQ